MNKNVVLDPGREPLRKTGVVRDYSAAKQFGFINAEDGAMVYFHHTGLVDEVKRGDRVSFHLQDDGKRGMAVNIRRY